MYPYLHLDAVETAIVHVLGVLALSMVLPYVIRPTRISHRVFLYLGVYVFALRYVWWRGTETLAPPGFTLDFLASWSFFGIELVSIVGALSASVIMMRHRDRRAEATANTGWWRPDGAPRVAIMIATYNESLEVLERTIVGAKALRHTNKQIVVLDDGKRDWLRDYCRAQSVRYIRRPDNKGAKAGNLNHALDVLAADRVPPDFVSVLDADFVPHQGFISRTLALFHDPEVGLVQTPQHFFNPDPVQHNLGLSASFPDEQRFFFDHVQPARDAWGITICCGTSSMIRWSALREVGGFSTLSVTEDFLLTLVLRDAGYSTVYLNEALTEGLAPEGLKEYVTQRGRWCLGTLQIARTKYGPLARNKLRLRDRWSVLDSSLYWSASFLFRLAALVYPLFYWFGNVIVVNAPMSGAIDYFGCYYVWTMMTFNLLARNMMVPVLNDVQQILGAIPITKAAAIGLFGRRDQAFKVTAKGGERDRVVVQWGMMRPFLILFGLTFAGLWAGIVSDSFAFNDAGDGKVVILFWSVYNLFVLAVTMVTCVELPRQEMHVGDKPERSIAVLDGTPRRIWIVGLTIDTVRLRGFPYGAGARGRIRIRDVGDVEGYVVAETRDGAQLHLLPTAAQREALFERFYAQGDSPGVTSVRRAAVLRDITERLALGRRVG
ncbi:glycosyltransferase [Acidimangrovimonas sediminis]|uniref:glycosyltransferase n=1 Tax=Acidimangrovimonas sediminis TaxID=2056283 RepID=UPI000C80F3FC|nr:cellulose synthase catalytic subunit [Acidimangrovimonas sediminis]